MRHSLNFILIFLGLVTVALTGSGCAENEALAEETSRGRIEKRSETSAQKPTADDVSKTLRPANVKVEPLKETSITEYIVAHGTTQAIRDVTYSAEVPGRIEALPVDIGDRIRKGRVIARIDFGTLQAQAEQAETAYNLAESTYKRLAALQGEEVISQQRIDEAKSNMLSAKAGVTIAKANVKKAVVRSTYSGIVGAKFVEKGEYVAPGSPLVMVVDYKTIIVEAKLAETQTRGIVRGAKVMVDIEALGKAFEGEVETLIPTADKASKTFTLRIKIDNPKYEILVGMSATVRLTAKEHDNVIAVSQSTVVEEPGGRSIFIAKDGKAEKRSVRLGAVQGDKVVLTEGVSPGEAVIVVGQRDIEDGQPIRIIN